MAQLKSAPLNVFTSQVCYDHTSKSREAFTVITDAKARNMKVVELMNKYDGQVLAVVNIRTNEVRNWLITGWAGRVHITHLLFGDWRIAEPADIARHAEKNKSELERITKAEAKRLAVASGLVMKEMAGTAAAITRLNEMAKPETAPAAEPPQPTADVKAAVAASFAEAPKPAPKKRGRPAKVAEVTA